MREREVTRNRCPDGRYRTLHVQARYLKRQKAPYQKKMDHTPLCDYVEKQLKEECSPKTISELLVLDYPDDTRMRISHESLYQYVYADKRKGGELYKGLRQGRVISNLSSPGSFSPWLNLCTFSA